MVDDMSDNNANEKSLYEWVSFPARERIKTTIILLVFLILFFIGVYYSFRSLVILIMSVVILGVSLWSYFTPKWYKMNNEGVEIRTLITKRRKPWKYFKSYYYDKKGIQLSTFSYPSRLDTFRGFSLLFGKNNKAEVIEFIDVYLNSAEKKRKIRR